MLVHMNESGTAFVALMHDPSDMPNLAKLKPVLFVDSVPDTIFGFSWYPDDDALDSGIRVVTGDHSFLVEHQYVQIKPAIPVSIQHLTDDAFNMLKTLNKNMNDYENTNLMSNF